MDQLQPTSDPGRFVQLTLHTSQTMLLANAARDAANIKGQSPLIANMYQDLADTFDEATRWPTMFPVQGRMARSLKVRYRRLKGERERGPERPTVSRANRTRRRKEARAARRANRGS